MNSNITFPYDIHCFNSPNFAKSLGIFLFLVACFFSRVKKMRKKRCKSFLYNYLCMGMCMKSLLYIYRYIFDTTARTNRNSRDISLVFFLVLIDFFSDDGARIFLHREKEKIRSRAKLFRCYTFLWNNERGRK